MKFRKTKHCRGGKEQQHRIQENKSTNCSVGILYSISPASGWGGGCTAKDHQSDEIHGEIGEFQSPCRVKHQWYTKNTKNRIKNPHEYVIDFLRILLSRFEFEGTIVASEIAGESDQHLP